jgi:hypothetical protein
MRNKIMVAALCAAIGGAAFAGVTWAQDGPPPPTSGTLLTGEIGGATGAAIGPDGALYVPQGGTGGDQVLDPPPEAGFEGEVTFGLTASIVRVDPASGEVTTEASDLPSLAVDGEGSGIADVAFIGSNLYFLLTGSMNEVGVEEWPNGVYRVTGDSGAVLVADISAFNDANPVDFPDAFPGGNPFGLQVRSGEFIATDGNYNRVLRITTGGNVSILTSFDNVVPTGIEATDGGPVYVTQFSAFPHAPADGKVVQITVPSGAVSEIASGFSQMIDVEFGPGNQLYALNFGDAAGEQEGEPPPSGKLFRVEGSTLTPLVDGIAVPTSLDIDGETAFITTLAGQVWKVDGISSLEELTVAQPTAAATQPAAPTATPPGGVIGAPDTGTGAADDGGIALLPLVLLALTGAGLAIAGARVASRDTR